MESCVLIIFRVVAHQRVANIDHWMCFRQAHMDAEHEIELLPAQIVGCAVCLIGRVGGQSQRIAI